MSASGTADRRASATRLRATPLGASDQALVPTLRKLGNSIPVRMLQAAEATGLPVALATSILAQESGGGRNEWGHDPTIFVGGYDRRHAFDYGPVVTKAAYLAYKAERGPTGAGGMQGVGPCQLTYYSLQDRADAIGGCWAVAPNLHVGFSELVSLIRRDGLEQGIAAYNGAGAAAERYAQVVLARADTYARALGRPYR